MRLNWFSPLPPAPTEVAAHTVRTLEALPPGVEVVLWTDQAKWAPDLERFGAVRRFDAVRIPWREINRADLNIYQLGNNYDSHGAIWEVSRRQPGLVVLHDLAFQHFFLDWHSRRNDYAGYVRRMAGHYGTAGIAAARACWRRETPIGVVAQEYPLTGSALENALAVLVHSTSALPQLQQAALWPVAYAPLPYPATARPLSAQRALVRPPYRLIVFGYLGLNRRLEAVLQALADLPCRDQFHLDIFGSLPNRDWLWGLIRALGLKNHVSLHGFVEEARLKAALETAHLAINLRFPTMGEASASQLRIWDHALPSLVSRVGWYATLPADTVAFVDPQREVRDLQQHLLAFAAHPARYAQLGENGRRLLEEQHTPKGYVRCLLELAANTERFHARQGAHRLAQRAAALLPDCLGPTIPPSFYQRLGSAIHSLAAG